MQTALLTGRLYQQDPSHEYLLRRELADPVFQQYVSLLSEQHWMAFQPYEKIYRDHLNTNQRCELNFVYSMCMHEQQIV